MAIEAADERIERCEEAMRDLLPSLASGAGGARAHGDERFQTVAAMILVSELGEDPSLYASAPGDGLSGVGADGEHFQ